MMSCSVTSWSIFCFQAKLTWDQALFSFRFENNILAGKAKGMRTAKIGPDLRLRQSRLCHRWPSRTFMLYSWRADLFFNRLWNNVYNRWIKSNFPCKWHRTASKTSGWKSSPARIFHRNSSGERRLKFIASGSKKTTALQTEHRLAQPRQWCQHSDHKHVQRHRQNTQCDYTASETDEEREHRRPTLQKATRQAIRQRLKFIVKIILSIISKLFVVKYSLL